MNIFDKIYQRARNSPKKIVLPEGLEMRIIEAALHAAKENLARIILLGKADVILKKAKRLHLDISKVEIIDPKKDKKADDYIKSYSALRKHKGVTVQYARDLLLHNFVYYGAMMLRQVRVDGFIAGASHTTSDVARACLHCIRRDSKHSTVSGSFLVEIKDTRFGEDGLFLFADCGIVPQPKAQQLAEIAVTSAEVWVKVTGYKPRIAMLSFSSHGSSSHASIDRVRKACAIAKKTKPDLVIDGELQVDSAVVPAVAKIKVPGSTLAGKANILIFPNLDAGNIAYKLMQRLAGARVVGPIIQGMSKPSCDVSRGCSPREITDAIAVTSVRAQ